MAACPPEQAAVAANVAALFVNALRGRPCRVFGSNLRVRVETGLATYPDITIVCGSLETDPEDRAGNTATNPTLVVEVLSPSTENYDRGEKLAHYKRIASLREILLVAHDERRLELRVSSLGCELACAEVYRNPLA